MDTRQRAESEYLEHHGVRFTVGNTGTASDYDRMWHFTLVVGRHYLRSCGRFSSRRKAIGCAERLIDRMHEKGMRADARPGDMGPCPRCGRGVMLDEDPAGGKGFRVRCPSYYCRYGTGWHEYASLAWIEYEQQWLRAHRRMRKRA